MEENEERNELERAIEESLRSHQMMQQASSLSSVSKSVQAQVPVNDDGNEEESALIAAAISESYSTYRRRKREAEEEDSALAAAMSESYSMHRRKKLNEEVEDGALAVAVSESYSTHKRRKLNGELNSYATKYTIDRSQEKQIGSWDCPRCTLMNRPYAPRCGMCDAVAPPHVLVFQHIPSLRFGIEIEIIIPNGKADGFTMESIARDLTALGPEKVKYLGYTHDVTHNMWKIVTDASIQANNGDDQDLCFELVSPVLQGEGSEGLGQLRNVMDNVKRIGIATNTSCGFHVHVDAEPNEGSDIASLEALKSLSRCFVSVENAFDLLASNSEHKHRRTNRNKYCQSNRIAFGQMSNRQRWNQIGAARSVSHLVDLMNPQQDRYRKLNLTNLIRDKRPSTCEFRHHGGVQHVQEAEGWVRLILAFCYNASVKHEEAQRCLLREESNVKDEVRALFDLVACPGLAQMFTVDRKLFAEELSNQWRCKSCRRQFKNSRSLSQHCIDVGHRMY